MSKIQFEVRPAQPADLSFLANIERAAAQLFPPGRIPDLNDSYPAEALEEAMKNGLLFTAVSQKVVGFATCHVVENYLHLAEMSVLPEYGRNGIGRRLLQQVIDTAKARHLHGVTLTTFADIPFNAPFYQSLGFEIIKEAELSPTLAFMLNAEAKYGLTNRVAMVYRF